MKKGILIIVAILLMILAIFPVVDYFYTKGLVYGKGEVNQSTEYQNMQQYIGQDLNFDRHSGQTFFNYFKYVYGENNTQSSATYSALMSLITNNNKIFEDGSGVIVPYICYIIDLFIIWFVLFAILQVPIFTIRLMGLEKDKGGKRL